MSLSALPTVSSTTSLPHAAHLPPRSWCSRVLFPKSLSQDERATCKQLLEKTKQAFWRGVSSEKQLQLVVASSSAFIQRFSKGCAAPDVVELERYTNALVMRMLPDTIPSYRLSAAEPKARFGLSREIAAKHPDFADFMSYHGVRAPRHRFGHLEIGAVKGEPLLHFEGKEVLWNSVKKQIFGNEVPPSLKLPHGWKYLGRGVVHEDLFKWKKLQTCWKDDQPAQPGQFYIELVSKLGHCYFRLIDDRANVIGVGFFGGVQRCFPMRSRKGMLASPDPWEYKVGLETSVRIPINKEQYEKAISKIESDQNNEELYFNMITRNCSNYASEVLQEIGIKLDLHEHVSLTLAKRIGSNLGIKLPKCLQTILSAALYVLNFILSPILSLVAAILGATYSNPNLAELEKTKGKQWADKWRRPLSSFRSIFDRSNFYIATGWKLVEWQKEQPSYKEKRFPNNGWNSKVVNRD